MKFKKQRNADYTRLKLKIFWRSLAILSGAVLLVAALYLLVWRGRMADWIVAFLQSVFRMDLYTALSWYERIFRNNAELFWIGATLIVFFLLFRSFLTWFTRYFDEVTKGIDSLLEEKEDSIVLPPEMSAVEKS